MFSIDKLKVRDAFSNYTKQFDTSDGKVKLKIDHTYRVAALCERIARSLGLCDDDVELAWLMGMLHDIGRFEQLWRYGTFLDEQSIDHAHFAVELLWEEEHLRAYIAEAEEGIASGISPYELEESFGELTILRLAIWNHSAYKIDETLDERTKQFCYILRDADKLDIFKVFHDTKMEEIYHFTKEQAQVSGVSEAVVDAFMGWQTVLRSLKKLPADYIIGNAAMAFDLRYDVSCQIAKEQGYLAKVLEFPFENPETKEIFAKLRLCMEEYMKEKGV